MPFSLSFPITSSSLLAHSAQLKSCSWSSLHLLKIIAKISIKLSLSRTSLISPLLIGSSGRIDRNCSKITLQVVPLLSQLKLQLGPKLAINSPNSATIHVQSSLVGVVVGDMSTGGTSAFHSRSLWEEVANFLLRLSASPPVASARASSQSSGSDHRLPFSVQWPQRRKFKKWVRVFLWLSTEGGEWKPLRKMEEWRRERRGEEDREASWDAFSKLQQQQNRIVCPTWSIQQPCSEV